MSKFKAFGCAVVAAGLFCCVPSAPAQLSVGINLGPAPVCPYGYFDYAPYDCAPYGYYGPDWFDDGIFIGAGPGFMGLDTSMATSITASILIMAITDRYRSAAQSPLTTSTAMRRVTATVTRALPVTMEAMSGRCPAIVAAADMAAIARPQLNPQL